MRLCEKLSHRQRRRTPDAFASYLISRVLGMRADIRCAALWVDEDTVYRRWQPLVECWPESRDARTYAGPWPIIAHPPCGPWGKFKGMCTKQSPEHGIIAMNLVHRFGGVVEQPLGSTLFRDHRAGGWIEEVDQHAYGHLARKRTLLYFALPDPERWTLTEPALSQSLEVYHVRSQQRPDRSADRPARPGCTE